MVYNSFIGTAIMLLSSLAATLLDSAIVGGIRSHKRNSRAEESDTFSTILLHLFVSLIIYVVLSVAIVTVYALVRSRNGLSSFSTIFENLIAYYIESHIVEFFFVPLLAYVFAQLIRLKWCVKGAVAVFMAILLGLSPLVIRFEAPNRFPMESEILTELRSVNVPYEGRLVDIKHFRSKTEEGYWIGERLDPEPKSDDEDYTDEYYFVENPTSLGEYVNNCVYYRNNENREDAIYWIEEAYEFYLSGGAASQNAIGRMWYYKGLYEDADYYINAAEIFIGNNEYYNAAISYEALYGADSQYDYVQRTLECYIKAVSNNDSPKKSQRNFKELICNFEISDMMAFVRDMHEFVPEDAFLSVLILNDNYIRGNNTSSDEEMAEAILGNEKYAHCPKLMILQALYTKEDIVTSYEGIYELYLTHDDFFEPEDKVNLAWILYQAGEYVKAYQIAVGMYDYNEEKENAVLLRAESFLQDETAMSETDKEALYRDVSEAIEADNVSEESIQRLKLVQCILAGKLGLDPNFTNLSEICTSLFGEESVTGMYIIASLDCREGLYSDAIEMCNKILGQIDAPNYFYNSVLFLKADALMGCAKDVSQDERQDFYEKAEGILNSIRENIGNDYITCLQKLNDLYKVMDNRDQELQEITDILMHLK